MYILKTIEHSSITATDLSLIINIKSVAWHYSFQQHKSWIENNISKNDIHLFLYKDEQVVAYMNLVDVEAIINHIPTRVWGIGNVCSIESGKGYGQELMKQTNDYIKQSNKQGLLFCKDILIKFYSKYKWQLIDKELLQLNFDNTSVNTLIYNNQQNTEQLIYKDKSF